MPSIDYRALGFAFTAADAADVLGRTVAQVHDLVRAGELAALVTPTAPGAPLTPLMFRFHPDEVARLEVRLRESTLRRSLAADSRNRLRVFAALRDYLAAVPAQRGYDAAMRANAPLWCATRGGDEVLAVRAEAVAAFGTGRDGASMSVSMTQNALEYAGAIRARGVTPADEPGQQRWHVWWRLPEGWLPGAAAEVSGEDSVIKGLVSGATEPEERLTRRGAGPVRLLDPLVAADDVADDASVD